MIDEMILLYKLKRLQGVKKESCWNNNSFLYGNDIFHYFQRYISKEIIIQNKIKQNAIAITDLYGLSFTNTNLAENNLTTFFDLTKDWKKVPCLTEDDFFRNCDWITKRTKNWICYFQAWNKRTYIDSFDGSHHISAVYRQSIEQDLNYMINCTVYEEIIDIQEIEKIEQVMCCFFMDGEIIHKINSLVLKYSSTQNNNPIIYPIKTPHLLIRKNNFGRKIIEIIKSMDISIELISEMQKFLATTSV